MVVLLAWPEEESLPSTTKLETTGECATQQQQQQSDVIGSSSTSTTRTTTGTPPPPTTTIRNTATTDGFVIGWRDVSYFTAGGGRDNSIIAIDVITFDVPKSGTMNNPDTIMKLFRKEYHTIKSKIDWFTKSRNRQCYCCTCTATSKKSTSEFRQPPFRKLQTITTSKRTNICGGCTRRICFHEHCLDVVGFRYNNLILDKTTDVSFFQSEMFQDLLNELNILFLTTTMDGNNNTTTTSAVRYPTWNINQNQMQQQQQLLIYKSSSIHFTFESTSAIYRNEFGLHSFFVLLTHAGTIGREIRRILFTKSDRSFQTFPSTHETSPLSTQIEYTTKNKESKKRRNSRQEECHYQPSHSNSSILLKSTFHYLQKHSLFLRYYANDWRWYSFSTHKHRAGVIWNIVFPKTTTQQHGSNVVEKCTLCQEMKYDILSSHYEEVQRITNDFNVGIGCLLDWVVGLMISFVVIYLFFKQSFSTKAIHLVRRHYEIFSDGLIWLENFPIGFKLNVPLTLFVGRWIRLFLLIHERIMLLFVEFIVADTYFKPMKAIVLVLYANIFGARGLFLTTVDIFKVMTLHITFLHYLVHELYRGEVYLVLALWRLFRGKKWNILRQRTDTMHYDSMQLLVGTILFASVLFLFTTIVLYKIYFMVIGFVTFMTSALLSIPFFMIHSFPLGELMMHYLRPYWFCEFCIFEVEQKQVQHNDLVIVTTLLPCSTQTSALVLRTVVNLVKEVFFLKHI